MVSVPADASVGVGRAAEQEQSIEFVEQPDLEEDNEEEDKSTQPETEAKSLTFGGNTMSDTNIDQIREDAP